MLTADEFADSASAGFVVRRRLVGESLVAELNDEVDRLRRDQREPDGTTGIHFWFRLADVPVAARVFDESGVRALAEQLTAPNTLTHAHGHIQVAVTIPPWRHVPGGPHLDGYHDPARPHPFTMVVGVALTPTRGRRSRR